MAKNKNNKSTGGGNQTNNPMNEQTGTGFGTAQNTNTQSKQSGKKGAQNKSGTQEYK
ncbi:hypothetical protein FACS1894191_7670 [Clostridia bacterium]|nr:hypothetical protein FACS1894191_7670 [Clostridia bacterium]